MNRHALLLRGFVIFRVGEKMTSGKSNGASGLLVGELHALVGPIYINDNAEQQDCRDSVGF
jgi:hypothetical protein